MILLRIKKITEKLLDVIQGQTAVDKTAATTGSFWHDFSMYDAVHVANIHTVGLFISQLHGYQLHK